MEKYDVSEMDSLIKKTGKLIDEDPLLSAGDEIDSIKENFEAIHRAINDEAIDEEEKQGLLAKIFGSWASKDKRFQFKSFEGKINSIFRQFDLTYESVVSSIGMYTEYAKGLVIENDKLDEFIKGIDESKLEPKEQRELQNYKLMLDNLKIALGRINMSKESADELSETMRISRPIFQTLLSSCMIEISGQRSIQASVQMLETISGTIEGMSSKLTENTIKTSQIALEVGSKPVLTASKIHENMLLLKGAFDDLEDRKNKYLLNKGSDSQEEMIITAQGA